MEFNALQNMFALTLISLNLLITLIQGEIPNLSVRRLDKSLIARKRQDTRDMCRIFTEENTKMEFTEPKIIPSYKKSEKTYRRHKREAGLKYAVNPALTENDVKRVEEIVEKLYDDMEEQGEKVTYVKNTVAADPVTVQPQTNTKENPNRRLFFAPATLLGPESATDNQKKLKYNITKKSNSRWKHGIIPYFIDSKTYDAHLSDIIVQAFDYVEKATCIRLQKLRERPTDQKSLQYVDWIYITNPTGIRQCVHSNEKRKLNGVQMIVFGYDCMSLGDIIHEIMHVLGFSHEHTRFDRDNHISILWENIKPGYKKYFEKNSQENKLDYLPYDYSSVLHYPSRAFSKNGQATILVEPRAKIGQREGFSEIDVEKVNIMYSAECVDRNRDYLLKTCPSVVNTNVKTANVTQKDITNYFKNRLWPFGLVNYKLRDTMEFSTEERANINAVMSHIEQETCILFRDVGKAEEINDDASKTDDTSNKTTTFKADKSFKPDLPKIIIANQTDDNDDDAASDGKLLRDMRENEIKGGDDEKGSNFNFRKSVKSNSKVINSRTVSSPTRRHADSILILARSPLPGCKCPPPGRPDGNQLLKINADCFNSVNDLLHLFVHVLGLDHQHNMYDRDSYLHIIWANLTSDIKDEMQKKLPPAASVGFPYDYQSVTHFPWMQIKNGVTNIMYPIWNDGWSMGHWQGLSSTDIQKLNLLYFDRCLERQKQSQSQQ